jgi:signal transduction histidine kinase
MADGLPDLDSLQRDTMAGLLERIVVVRLFVGPVLALVLLALVWLDPRPWRLSLAVFLLGFLGALSAIEYWRLRKGWSGPAAFPPNAVAMVFVQLGAVTLTGGIDSPFVVILPVMLLQLSIVLGPSAPLAVALAAQLSALWALFALRLSGAVLALPQLGANTPSHAMFVATVLTFVSLVTVVLGTKVRAAMLDQVRRALAAHDSERVAHADHSRELAALTGEIAHELKNPLASIKGLAALLSKDATGRSADRLAVLRSEVDRMQERLEAFLTFSRPLVPLAQTPVDAGALAQEVAALCEGLAYGRGVALQVAEGGADLRADRRKLRQVLVNLVQNAIEASPPGAAVTVRAVPGEQVTIEVLDRGPGLPTDGIVPGVSTKESGSGLGLTIARALVGQHHGTLALVPRDGGGTVARVVLPAAGAP